MEQGTRFFFSQDRNWFKCAMFSDEKWIVLSPYSNRQNERAYASSDPHFEIQQGLKDVLGRDGVHTARCTPSVSRTTET